MPFVSIIKGRLFVYHPEGETKLQSLNQGPFFIKFRLSSSAFVPKGFTA